MSAERIKQREGMRVVNSVSMLRNPDLWHLLGTHTHEPHPPHLFLADSLCLCLASLDPLLEQVFIVTVSSSTQCVDAEVGELPAVGVDEHGHQTLVLPFQFVHLIHYLHYCILSRETKY